MTTSTDTRAWKLVDNLTHGPATVYPTREDALAYVERMPEEWRASFDVVECDPIPSPPPAPVVPWATRVLVEESQTHEYPHTCEATIRMLDDDEAPFMVGIEATYEARGDVWQRTSGPAVLVWERNESGTLMTEHTARTLAAALVEAADRLAHITAS